MTQRNLAGAARGAAARRAAGRGRHRAAAVRHLPPGPTVDVLGDADGQEIIQVDGHKTYRDDGQLRMTTVSTSPAEATVNLFEPWRPGSTATTRSIPTTRSTRPTRREESSRQEGEDAMVTSQDPAVAAALTELGYEVTEATVDEVVPGTPADGKLEVRDVVLEVDGKPVATERRPRRRAIRPRRSTRPSSCVVRRDDERLTVTVTPGDVDGEAATRHHARPTAYDFPFDVNGRHRRRHRRPERGPDVLARRSTTR